MDHPTRRLVISDVLNPEADHLTYQRQSSVFFSASHWLVTFLMDFPLGLTYHSTSHWLITLLMDLSIRFRYQAMGVIVVVSEISNQVV